MIPAAPRPNLRRPQSVAGADSWVFASDRVQASLTRVGGHLAPVQFQTARGVIQPYAIAPWAGEALPENLPAVLGPLRGDFFCAPFGGGPRPWRGERHPDHGETATRPWSLVGIETGADGTELVARMETQIRPGEVTKRIVLRSGETNVYSRHELRGFSGPMNLGHHAMLAFPEENGPGQILLSPWRRGQVAPRPFESPETGGYSALKVGARFRDLRRVPLAVGGVTDLTQYPARPGFEDLVMVSARAGQRVAWTTVTFAQAGWLWFSLKDPRTLASTVLWHSNGGRHYPPWNSRHRRVLGLEEVTSYFHLGLAESAAANPVAHSGIPTVLRLRPDRTQVVNTIMGVVALPRNFGRLQSVHCANDHLLFTSASGSTVRHEVDVDFLFGAGRRA